jgi:hypothetical protein
VRFLAAVLLIRFQTGFGQICSHAKLMNSYKASVVQ